MTSNFLSLEEKFIKKHHAKKYDFSDELVLVVAAENLRALLRDLRDDTNYLYSMLISICGVDYPHLKQRFEVIYNLLSLKFNQRIRVKVKLHEKEEVPSIQDLFSAANWYEREVFDMYGVKFTDSNDLRRILTDYNFKHHPLRKDFPLTGYEEVRYDIEEKKVVYEPVKLDQEYRNFDYLSPWEGRDAEQILPGDEKAFDILNQKKDEGEFRA
jgi:NADH-quinone oxidoreductase subunit C